MHTASFGPYLQVSSKVAEIQIVEGTKKKKSVAIP